MTTTTAGIWPSPVRSNQRHHRDEKEGDQEGQRDRDEDDARPVQARDGHHEDGQDEQPWRGVPVDGPEVTHSRRKRVLPTPRKCLPRLGVVNSLLLGA